MKILVIGSGGREHALVWKIAQSNKVKKIYCAPGNGGTSLLAQNLVVNADDIVGLKKFAIRERIDLTIVGPEIPLVAGIVDEFQDSGLKIFGPKKETALLEGSKAFAKEIMKKYKIPTASFEIFNNAQSAKKYIEKKGTPIVIKADGLAAGKGVVVAKTIEEAFLAIDLIMVKKEFGPAGNKIVIEDCLIGQEASILAICDGNVAVPLVSAQDHKRIFDADTGPNTGGMGAYASAPIVDDKVLGKIVSQVFTPLMNGLKKEGKPYKGVLYAGMMLNGDDLNVLEFNCRFGDPETQVILPKMKNDLVDVLLNSLEEKLNEVKLEWDERFCLSVVLAAAGYPGSYQKGKEINGLESLADKEDIFVFHAGTKLEARPKTKKHILVTNGGRVLNVVGLGKDIKQAQGKVYEAISQISFDGMHYRHDIGNKALQF